MDPGRFTADMEASLTYQFNENTAGSFLRIYLRASGATGSSQMPNAYRLEVGSNSTSIVLQRFQNSVVTQIGSFPYTSGTTAQRVRFRVQGSTIEAKVWAAGTPEPASWSKVVTDTALTGSGVVQIAHSFSSGTHTVYLDDLDVTDLTKTAVTTYTNGPSDLLSTDTNGEVTYPLADLHGDIVGNLDIAGGDTTNYADEYGAHQTSLPQNNLGWLGTKERFIEDQLPGNGTTTRMGERLYDSLIGRFIQVDPVEGGSANNYDYSSADPVNHSDLSGEYDPDQRADARDIITEQRRIDNWHYQPPGVCRNLVFRGAYKAASDRDYIRGLWQLGHGRLRRAGHEVGLANPFESTATSSKLWGLLGVKSLSRFFATVGTPLTVLGTITDQVCS